MPDERDGSGRFDDGVDGPDNSLSERAGGVSGESSEGDWDDFEWLLSFCTRCEFETGVPVGGGVELRRRGLLDRTIGSVIPRELRVRPFGLERPEGWLIEDPVVDALTRGEPRCLDDELSSFELELGLGESSKDPDEREIL